MESLPGYDAWKTRVPEDDSEDLSGTVTITIERENGDFEVTSEIYSGQVVASWEYGSKRKERIELTEEEKERAVETFERGDGGARYYEHEREEFE